MNMAQGVANAVTPVGAAAQPSSVTPQTGSIGGIPTQDEIYLGDTPVGEGWTLVGSLRGQKKWARGADMSALNAGAAAQTAANQAIPGTTVNPRATPGAGRGTPIKTSPVTPPAPAQSYRSLGPGQGVAPTAKVVPEPPMTYGEYDQARTALKQTIEPGSPEARATFGRMKDFEDKAAEEQATVERRKRLMLPPA